MKALSERSEYAGGSELKLSEYYLMIKNSLLGMVVGPEVGAVVGAVEGEQEW